MTRPVPVIQSTPTGRARVRLDGCPRCYRPLVLDHCSETRGDREVVDLNRVAFAQNLHLANCSG